MFGPSTPAFAPLAWGTPLTRKPTRNAIHPLPAISVPHPAPRRSTLWSQAPAGIRSASPGAPLRMPRSYRLSIPTIAATSRCRANQPPTCHCVRASLRGSTAPATNATRASRPPLPRASLTPVATRYPHLQSRRPQRSLNAHATFPPQTVPSVPFCSATASVNAYVRASLRRFPTLRYTARACAHRLLWSLRNASSHRIPMLINSPMPHRQPPHYGNLSARVPRTCAQCRIMPNTASYS